MLYLKGEKLRICGLAKVLSPQITKKVGSANPQSVSICRKVHKSNELFPSTNFRICGCYLRTAYRCPLAMTLTKFYRTKSYLFYQVSFFIQQIFTISNRGASFSQNRGASFSPSGLFKNPKKM
jgi:hypothetical protein